MDRVVQAVVVSIVRFVDGAFPGWVECVLRDAQGVSWTFVEKVPVVSAHPLDSASTYPQRGLIACEVTGDDSTGTQFGPNRHVATVGS